MKTYLLIVLGLIIFVGGGWIVYNNIKTEDSSNTEEINSSEISGKVLDYSNQNLTEVGPEIYEQTDTVELILSNNQLTSLPSELGNMTKLKVLKVDNNLLEGSLIAEIRKMPLVLLDASNNNMTGVPAEIGQIKTLETFNIFNNGITEFPNEIADISGNLKELNVSGNPLTEDTVTKLNSSLPNTQIIY